MLYKIYNDCIALLPFEEGYQDLPASSSQAEVVTAMLKLIENIKSRRKLVNTRKEDWEVYLSYLPTISDPKILKASFEEIYTTIQNEFYPQTRNNNSQKFTAPQKVTPEPTLKNLYVLYVQIETNYLKLINEITTYSSSSSSSSSSSPLNKKAPEKTDDIVNALNKFAQNIQLSPLEPYINEDQFDKLTQIKKDLQLKNTDKISLFKTFAKELCGIFSINYPEQFERISSNSSRSTKTLLITYSYDKNPFQHYQDLNDQYIKIEQDIFKIMHAEILSQNVELNFTTILKSKKITSSEEGKAILQNLFSFAKMIDLTSFQEFIEKKQLRSYQDQQGIILSLDAPGLDQLYKELSEYSKILTLVLKPLIPLNVNTLHFN